MSTLIDLVREDFGISGSGRWWRSDVHSSLVVDSEKDLFFFNSRGIRGNAVDYLMKVRGLPRKMSEEIVKRPMTSFSIENRKTSVQTRFEKLVDLFYSSGKLDRKYWYKRNIDNNTIDRYKLGYFDGWYLIPIYDDGLFINFQCRMDEPIKKIKFWYRDDDFKPVLYNKDILKFIDTAYITEGMVDCLLLNQLGFPSVCSTNGALSWNPEWIKYFTKIKNIFYIADNDNAGISGAKSVSKFLGKARVKIFRFKDKENKYGSANYFNDGGTVEEFNKLLQDNSVSGFEVNLI